jgi:hypothetical protein
MADKLLAMKRLKRTAQGFSPGDPKYASRPERATDARDVLSGCPGELLGHTVAQVRSPLQGDLLGSLYPGLEALGYSLRPFHGQDLLQ